MGVNDVNSLSHTKWNCKYHKCLHRNTEEKYFSKRKKRQSEKYCGNCVSGRE